MTASDYTLARMRRMASRHKPARPWLRWLLCAVVVAVRIAICLS